MLLPGTGNIVGEPHRFPGHHAWPGRGSRVIENLFLAGKNDMMRLESHASKTFRYTERISESLTTDRQAWQLREVALERPVPASTDCHVTEQTSPAANRVISNHVFPKRCILW